MLNILSFRPGVIGNNTAFEAMTAIYKYLQSHYDYRFTFICSETDTYYDQEFKVLQIPNRDWRSIFPPRFFPPRTHLPHYLRTEFEKADAVLTVDPTVYNQGRMAIAAAYTAKKPVWFDTSRTIQNDYFGIDWTIKRRFWLQSTLQQTTGIIATVPKCLERFQELGLLRADIADKFTIMGHPVDTSKFVPTIKKSELDGVLRILIVSRLIPEKGIFYILEAIDPLLHKNSNVELHILGDGVLRKLLEREVTQRQLSKKVFFLNNVPHTALPEVIAQFDIFVNHAVEIAVWEEFFGVANLEAMSCGLPCIVTDNGGISYSIRENAALFVSERNIIQLRSAVSQLLQSKDLRDQVGQEARKYVESTYAIHLVAERYHNMLKQHI